MEAKARLEARDLGPETRSMGQEAKGRGVHPLVRGSLKANGAGIAADPTLTSAWSLRLCLPLGEPSDLLSSQRAWRYDVCSASGCVLPVFPLRFRPSVRRLASRFVTGARTGIRPYFVTVFLSSSRSSLLGRAAPRQSRDQRYLGG